MAARRQYKHSSGILHSNLIESMKGKITACDMEYVEITIVEKVTGIEKFFDFRYLQMLRQYSLSRFSNNNKFLN